MRTESISAREITAIQEQLATLYSRRSVIDNLIQSLESHIEHQAKAGERADPKGCVAPPRALRRLQPAD